MKALIFLLLLSPIAFGQLPYSGINAGGVMGGNVNGVLYPGQCGGTNKPSWCSGTTADAWIMSACNQFPSSGVGIIDLTGLTGNITATTRGCSTPTRKIVFYTSNASLTITETDGDIAFPLDNSSMMIGPGAGQCQGVTQGITVGASANISAIVGPAHVDGTQENLTISGSCLWGDKFATATVTNGLIYARRIFSNTYIGNNMISICNTAGINLLDMSNAYLPNNWVNCTSGVNTVSGRPLWIHADSSFGTGCVSNQIQIIGGQYEHSIGGGFPEVTIEGNGAGAQSCGVYSTGMGIERNNAGTLSSVGVQITDCQNCNLLNVTITGTNAGTDGVNIAQTSSGYTRNVAVGSVNNSFGTYTNSVHDTTPGGRTFTTALVQSYTAQPQLQQSTIYSAAGQALPTCGAEMKGTSLAVSDATSPTFMGTYTSGGAITARVVCGYNGTTYAWQTH